MNNYQHDSLTLGLGFPTTPPPTLKTTTLKPHHPKLSGEPTLTLSLSGGGGGGDTMVVAVEEPASSLVSVKRERESGSCSDDLDVIERGGGCYSRVSDEEDEDGHVNTPRKKLRLNKHQSAMLEESFKLHSTLNPKQKQALADRLNLRPRQVEVWFQNRRARTKLKQTEVDCEYLKKYCESLTEENMKLQKEVAELKAMKLAQPYYMHLPAATLTMCPSCERIDAASPKTPFSMTPKTHRLFTGAPANRPLLVDN
ncbi:homeobox-leucine zipper protein HAT22-like [Silene latifolia]|uniref:homeobox-leucine zipper protein HAT22-like n=1 Tax=Silene latifolia TaxID=37657 RepID=UPI003D78356D